MTSLPGLQDLHAADALHTDVRWPNIIRMPDRFILIDLEKAVRIERGKRWSPKRHGPKRNAWAGDGQGAIRRAVTSSWLPG